MQPVSPIPHKPASGDTTYRTLCTVMLAAAALPLLFSIWCLYDGLVAYPQELERWQVYERLANEHPHNLSQQWQAETQVRGWSPTVPRKTTRMDVVTQHIMAGFCGTVGLMLIGSGVLFGWLYRKQAAKHPETPLL